MTASGANRWCEDRALSADPWVDAALKAALAGAIPVILERARSLRPRCLMLTGSAALGEAVGWESAAAPRRLVLSDLDLGLITVDRVPESARNAIASAAAAAGAAPNRSKGGRSGFDGQGDTEFADAPGVDASVRVTLGFYESAWWTRQVPTPGMVDARACGLVVWGDPTIPERLAVPAVTRLPGWEALRLIGNRALELLAAPGRRSEAGLRPAGWYALAKTAAALWTAQLILQGRYRTGWAARRAILDGESGGRDPSDLDAVVRFARAWAPFLDRPGDETLPPGAGNLEHLREALSGWLESLPSELRTANSPAEAAFLGEPVSMRQRVRCWRSAGRAARDGGAFAGAGGRGWWGGLRPWTAGTPEGRRMGAAVLYWLCLPERPEPCWGDVPGLISSEPTWEGGVRRMLGRSVPAGPGCRARLEVALGLSRVEVAADHAGEGGNG